MKTKLFLIPLLATVLTCHANAALLNNSYVGGSIGIKQDFDADNLVDNSDAKGTAYSIYSGYLINKVVGIETTYTDYGDIDSNGSNFASPTSLSMSANLGYTFDQGIRPFALVGLSYVDMNSSNSTLVDDSGVGFHMGFGVDYSPIEHLTLRIISQADALSVDRVTASKTDEHTIAFSSLQLGASYSF